MAARQEEKLKREQELRERLKAECLELEQERKEVCILPLI